MAYRIEQHFVEDHGETVAVYTVLDDTSPIGLATFETKGRAEAYIEGRLDAERGECRAALGQLLEQVYQMQGMFPDDKALERAIKDAEDALEQ